MASGTGTDNASSAGVESDGHLIGLVRGGDMSAFDELYERHVSVASTVARRNVDNPSDAEDVVAEAFQAVLQSLVAGRGPDNFFRAYLLSTVTRLSHHRNRKAGRSLPSSDDAILDRTMPEPDAVVKAFESHTVAKAFRALPERWQAVLWYLDVERMKPAAVAPLLGLSANAVSALALRAREGLRRQYLQAHVAEALDSDCAGFASKLGTFIRGGLSRIAERKMRQHLNGCSKCTLALSELKDVQGTMRAVLIPLVTGIPLATLAAKGAGLGVLGGLVPIKAAIVVPAIGQPAVMAMVAVAGLGLALGAVGIVGRLTPDVPMEQLAVETSSSRQESFIGTPAPVPTSNPSPALPGSPGAVEPSPSNVASEPSAAAPEPLAVGPVPSGSESQPSPQHLEPSPAPHPTSCKSPARVTWGGDSVGADTQGPWFRHDGHGGGFWYRRLTVPGTGQSRVLSRNGCTDPGEFTACSGRVVLLHGGADSRHLHYSFGTAERSPFSGFRRIQA
ncbi:sigma-70 family RNA polymerase sigma factor [Arthrobacter sp. StoSoilB13]|uniref:RNA polymerase sigma factor n=1 Tax=Arthrobacter sp. StoSoilB13 TaxID=2830993 RepID=UPI001CC5CB11|nr:sigma-70 family RNA polymerase sigma factor [Arthrobacter sp. StoSoilB13]